MNGKCAKRIRHATVGYGSRQGSARVRYRKLKKSYYLLPYHRRDTLIVESHSYVLMTYLNGGSRLWPNRDDFPRTVLDRRGAPHKSHR